MPPVTKSNAKAAAADVAAVKPTVGDIGAAVGDPGLISLGDTSASETVKTIVPVEDVMLVGTASICSVKYSVTYAGKKYSGIKEVNLNAEQFALMVDQTGLTPGFDESGTGTQAYQVNYLIVHDDEEYGVGSLIHLSDKQAEPLLSVGAISEQFQGVAEGVA